MAESGRIGMVDLSINLQNIINNKMDRVDGKDLSSNDFTDAYKTKLDGIASGATKVQESSNNGYVKINSIDTKVYIHPGLDKSVTNPHGTTKADVGLSNVTNDAQVKRSEMGQPNGVATLDNNGKLIQDATTIGGKTINQIETDIEGNVTNIIGDTIVNTIDNKTGDILTLDTVQYSSDVLAYDDDFNPTHIQYKRKSNNKLVLDTTASAPDSNGYYQVLTCKIFNDDGSTIKKTITYHFTFLESGYIDTNDGGVVS